MLFRHAFQNLLMRELSDTCSSVDLTTHPIQQWVDKTSKVHQSQVPQLCKLSDMRISDYALQNLVDKKDYKALV